MKPDLLDSFEYKGEHIEVEWYDVFEKEKIPDLPWEQIYSICNLDGEVPVVFYANGNENLPGGTVEVGESLDETIRREIIEELNCEVQDWQPIGYQILSSEVYGTAYQFRAVAKIRKLGEWKPDIGGSVQGYNLITLKDLNSRINYHAVGERMVELAEKSGFFEKAE